MNQKDTRRVCRHLRRLQNLLKTTERLIDSVACEYGGDDAVGAGALVRIIMEDNGEMLDDLNRMILDHDPADDEEEAASRPRPK